MHKDNLPEDVSQFLEKLIQQVIEENADQIMKLLKPHMVQKLSIIPFYEMRGLVEKMTRELLEQRIRHHLETTYLPEFDEIAQEKARREVRKRRKQLKLPEIDN